MSCDLGKERKTGKWQFRDDFSRALFVWTGDGMLTEIVPLQKV